VNKSTSGAARRTNSFSAAFSTTLLAIILLVPGLSGYELHKSDWSFVRVTRTGAIVWWEIWFGVVALVFAIFFWRRALRLLDGPPVRS
jgi:hypothetical protein